MAENVGNKWSALLNGAIDSDDTSLAFDGAVGTLPAASFRIVVQDAEDDETNREIMLVTAGAATPLTVSRGMEGTTAVAHADNSYVAHVLTAGGLQEVVDQILAGYTSAARACRVQRAAALNVTTTDTAVSWDTEVRDDGGFWNSGQPTRLTAPEDGWYHVGAVASHLTSNNDWLQGYLRRDGTTVLDSFLDYNAANTTPKALVHGLDIYLTAGQYVEFMIAAQVTQALNLNSQLAMWMHRIAPSSSLTDYFSTTHVYRSTDQNVSGSGVLTPISFDTEVDDTDGVWASGNPTQFVVPASLNGRRARLYAQATFSASSAGTQREIRIQRDGVTQARFKVPDAGSTESIIGGCSTRPLLLTAGEVFTCEMMIDTTGIGVVGAQNTHFGLYTVDRGGVTSDADPFIGPFNPYDATESSLAMTANQAVFQKFVPRKTVTVSQVYWRVVTQAGNLDFGIYDENMVRLGSTGSFACPAASGSNTRTLSNSVTLIKGRTYYFAAAASSSTYRTAGIVRAGGVLLPVAAAVNLLGIQSSALPLPSTATPSWENSSTVPRPSLLFV